MSVDQSETEYGLYSDSFRFDPHYFSNVILTRINLMDGSHKHPKMNKSHVSPLFSGIHT